jgi:hypothetical protein
VWRTGVHTSMLYFYGMLGLCSKSLVERSRQSTRAHARVPNQAPRKPKGNIGIVDPDKNASKPRTKSSLFGPPRVRRPQASAAFLFRRVLITRASGSYCGWGDVASPGMDIE